MSPSRILSKFLLNESSQKFANIMHELSSWGNSLPFRIVELHIYIGIKFIFVFGISWFHPVSVCKLLPFCRYEPSWSLLIHFGSWSNTVFTLTLQSVFFTNSHEYQISWSDCIHQTIECYPYSQHDFFFILRLFLFLSGFFSWYECRFRENDANRVSTYLIHVPMRASMNQTIHVQIEVVELDVIWVGIQVILILLFHWNFFFAVTAWRCILLLFGRWAFYKNSDAFGVWSFHPSKEARDPHPVLRTAGTASIVRKGTRKRLQAGQSRVCFDLVHVALYLSNLTTTCHNTCDSCPQQEHSPLQFRNKKCRRWEASNLVEHQILFSRWKKLRYQLDQQ